MKRDSRCRSPLLRWVGFTLTVIGVAFLVHRWGWFDVGREGVGWVRSLGIWKGPFFVGVSVLATVGMVPGSVICASAGILFGFWGGMFWSWVGINFGAVAAFLTGRFWVHGWVEHKMKPHLWYQALSVVLRDGGWKTLLWIRLLPIVPFNGLNYALSLTQVSFRNYILSAMVGLVPGAVMYAYLGDVVGNLTQLQTFRPKEPWEWALEGLGFLVAIVVSLLLGRKAMKIFRGMTK